MSADSLKKQDQVFFETETLRLNCHRYLSSELPHAQEKRLFGNSLLNSKLLFQKQFFTIVLAH